MKINANGTAINVLLSDDNANDYISLTDIAKRKNPEFPADVIKNWLRLRSTIEYLGVWEKLYNPSFKLVEFDQFKGAAGSNAFVMSPQKWINSTNAVGIISKSGRGGGTYAHSDIAFEFASWISPEFKLYIIKDYQRLKIDENEKKALGWNTKRALSKVNYRIHTDAIKEFMITPELTPQERGYVYASEADLLNMALFGKTASQFRNETGEKRKNLRDYATVEQLIVLVNLESMNADMIRQGISQSERLQKLRSVAYYQLASLKKTNAAKAIEAAVAKQLPE